MGLPIKYEIAVDNLTKNVSFIFALIFFGPIIKQPVSLSLIIRFIKSLNLFLFSCFLEEAHSRAPVYEKNLDNIIGMVHIKDLLKYKIKNNTDESIFLQSIKREILKVPPSMPVLDLLMKMQLTRLHMGIVIDEYGGTDFNAKDIVRDNMVTKIIEAY